MTITLSKTFDFDAAHFLPFVPDGHKCKRMHGHTYRVEVILCGQVRATGMLIDYADIAAAWQPLHDQLDHRVLNEVMGLENPTTEVLAAWIAARLELDDLARVRVYESATTWAEWAR